MGAYRSLRAIAQHRLGSQLVDSAARSSTLAALRDPRRLRTELFAGLVVALALIPETISFSIVAGVGPEVGLFTSFLFAMTIAIVGGRPAMISAAAGSVALVLAPLVRDHGVDYLVATVLLGGVLQGILALAGVAKLMRFVPHSVMTGFVNGLAILIFAAQLPHLIGVPWLVYPLTTAGLLVMVVLPRLTSAVPAPLVATTILTVLAAVFSLQVPTVGDEGRLGSGLPNILVPDVSLTVETLRIIFPYALAMAFVGLLETFITAKLVDELTESTSNAKREGWGQGVANVVTGLFGGMGGCAMIGQTMMNVKSCGGRTRISTFVAGASLAVMVMFASPVLAAIPIAALVAVMVMVSVATMDWNALSPSMLRRMPIGHSLTMLVTAAVVVFTENLAYGVLAGVAVALVLFVRGVSQGVGVNSISRLVAAGAGAGQAGAAADGGVRTYQVSGQLFFASSSVLADQFDYRSDPRHVIVDLTDSHVWDATTVAVLDAVRNKYAALGKTVSFVGLNEESAALHSRLTGSFKPAG